VAEPRSDRLAYTQVGFLENRSFEILRLEITGQDRSVMEYRFQDEQLDPRLEEKLFRFGPPPGPRWSRPTAGRIGDRGRASSFRRMDSDLELAAASEPRLNPCPRRSWSFSSRDLAAEPAPPATDSKR